MNVMRSRIWGSHIEALIYNLNRGQNQVRIFEIAPVYKKINSNFQESTVLSGLVYGSSMPEQWNNKKREVNFYDLKGDIETFSSNTLNINTPTNNIPGALHPGQAAELIADKDSIGWMGQLHPEWQQKYDLPEKTYLFELELESLINLPKIDIKLPAKFPPLRRDISVVVDKDIKVGEIINVVNHAEINRLIEFRPFDIYEGSGIGDGKKSIAFLILMQDTYKTLEDEEVNTVVDKILTILNTNFNATLR